MTLAILLAKSAFFATGAWLLWDAYPKSALVCAAGAAVALGFAFLAWRDR